MFPKYPRRKSARTQWCDYHAPNAYFITIAARDFQKLFGHVSNKKMYRNAAGDMLAKTFLSIPSHFPHYHCDEWVIMPDHVHFILLRGGKTPISHFAEIKKLQRLHQMHPRQVSSLIDVLQWYKGRTTHLYRQGVHRLGWQPFQKKLWHRSFHDSIILSQHSLNKVRYYIRANPKNYKRRRR